MLKSGLGETKAGHGNELSGGKAGKRKAIGPALYSTPGTLIFLVRLRIISKPASESPFAAWLAYLQDTEGPAGLIDAKKRLHRVPQDIHE